jgi:hypothetical protein
MWGILAGAIAGGLLVLLWPRDGRLEGDLQPRTWRDDMMDCVRAHADEGTLYQWGGGHGWRDPEYGVDCSGLVCECARRAGINLYMTADMMFKQLPEVSTPRPGDVAVYGTSSHANHVRVVDKWFPDEGRAATIGAEGGGSKVNDPVRAEQLDARVKRMQDHRTGAFLGFRTLDGYEPPSGRPMHKWMGAG